MTLKVGLTGGIACGKTMVSEVFFHLGIPVYNADKEAKKFYYNKNTLKELQTILPPNCFDSGKPDFKVIASMAFSDHILLEQLNVIIHPLVMKDFQKWTLKNNSGSYIIMESAILYESNYHNLFDKIISVYAPKNYCVEMLKKRDGLTVVDALKRIRQQFPAGKKAKMADFVIRNYPPHVLLPQILNIHQILLQTTVK